VSPSSSLLLLAKTVTYPAARSLCDSWAFCPTNVGRPKYWNHYAEVKGLKYTHFNANTFPPMALLLKSLFLLLMPIKPICILLSLVFIWLIIVGWAPVQHVRERGLHLISCFGGCMSSTGPRRLLARPSGYASRWRSDARNGNCRLIPSDTIGKRRLDQSGRSPVGTSTSGRRETIDSSRRLNMSGLRPLSVNLFLLMFDFLDPSDSLDVLPGIVLCCKFYWNFSRQM